MAGKCWVGYAADQSAGEIDAEKAFDLLLQLRQSGDSELLPLYQAEPHDQMHRTINATSSFNHPALATNILLPFTRQTFDPMRGTFDPIRGTFDPICGTFDPMRGTFDPMRGTFDPMRGTFDPKRGTFDPIRGSLTSTCPSTEFFLVKLYLDICRSAPCSGLLFVNKPVSICLLLTVVSTLASIGLRPAADSTCTQLR
jgi:hypothetical protein